jgi:hypothetical protein
MLVQRLIHCIRCELPHVGEHVAVDIERNRHRRVSKHLGDDLETTLGLTRRFHQTIEMLFLTEPLR